MSLQDLSLQNLKFGTTINCMDGRSLDATIGWMKEKYALNFIDSITEPGMDAFELNMNPEQRAWLKRKLEISIINHGSRTVSVVGHDDCAGNPIDHDAHFVCIIRDVETTKELIKEIDPNLDVAVIGLWAHESEDPKVWTIDEV